MWFYWFVSDNIWQYTEMRLVPRSESRLYRDWKLNHSHLLGLFENTPLNETRFLKFSIRTTFLIKNARNWRSSHYSFGDDLSSYFVKIFCLTSLMWLFSNVLQNLMVHWGDDELVWIRKRKCKNILFTILYQESAWLLKTWECEIIQVNVNLSIMHEVNNYSKETTCKFKRN